MPRTNPHHACDDFHHTDEATRRRYLDSPLSRRQVIAGGLGGALTIYASKALGVARWLEAAQAQAAASPNAPVLVSVFLPGGADLMNTIVPLHQASAYNELRPTVRIAEPLPLGSTGLGLHPALASGPHGGLKAMFERGRIGLLPGIDYDNPNLSHFHSRHFWETGVINDRVGAGWIGRWLDARGSGDNPLQGISVEYGTLSPAMRSTRAPVAALTTPDAAQLSIPGVGPEAFEQAMAAWDRIAAGAPSAPGPAAANNAARLTKLVGDRLAPYIVRDDVDPLAPRVEYPAAENGLGQRLSALAGMLALPLGIRAATVSSDSGFDTHANQARELAAGLTEAGQALAAFQADLEARGIADRVLTFVWTEFGRRPQQNESEGTDHGAGGIAWVQGTRVAPGVLTDYPDLTRRDGEDNLAVTIDFRRVYSSVLEQWLDTDAAEIIPGAASLGRLKLVA